jgi:hypothetical protein
MNWAILRDETSPLASAACYEFPHVQRHEWRGTGSPGRLCHSSSFRRPRPALGQRKRTDGRTTTPATPPASRHTTRTRSASCACVEGTHIDQAALEVRSGPVRREGDLEEWSGADCAVQDVRDVLRLLACQF